MRLDQIFLAVQSLAPWSSHVWPGTPFSCSPHVSYSAHLPPVDFGFALWTLVSCSISMPDHGFQIFGSLSAPGFPFLRKRPHLASFAASADLVQVDRKSG
jgi:hypothetical protein